MSIIRARVGANDATTTRVRVARASAVNQTELRPSVRLRYGGHRARQTVCVIDRQCPRGIVGQVAADPAHGRTPPAHPLPPALSLSPSQRRIAKGDKTLLNNPNGAWPLHLLDLPGNRDVSYARLINPPDSRHPRSRPNQMGSEVVTRHARAIVGRVPRASVISDVAVQVPISRRTAARSPDCTKTCVI